MTYYTTGMVNNDYDRKVLKECMTVVIQIYDDGAADTTGGCTSYYSPISMTPPGSVPDWAVGMTEVTVDGVDRQYFRFYK